MIKWQKCFFCFFQRTSLWKASSKGHIDVVKYLIEKGCDVDAKDKYGVGH